MNYKIEAHFLFYFLKLVHNFFLKNSISKKSVKMVYLNLKKISSDPCHEYQNNLMSRKKRNTKIAMGAKSIKLHQDYIPGR